MLTLPSPPANLWRRFAEGNPDVSVPSLLLRSWRRSRDQGAAVDGTPADGAFVARGELLERQAERDRLRFVARRALDDLRGTLDDAGYVGLLTDRDGVILDGFGGGAFLARAERAQLVVGARWGEGVRGTNAIGTALAEGTAVACVGRAHLHEANHRLVCYAAPIHGPDGEVAALLDLTGGVESASAFARGLAPSLAARIEDAWRRDAWDAALSGGWRALVASLDEARHPAAFVEAGGVVRHANAPMHALGAIHGDVAALTGLTWTALCLVPGDRVTSTEGSALGGRSVLLRRVLDDAGRCIALVLYADRGTATPRSAPAVPPSPRAECFDAFDALDGWRDELSDVVHRAARLARTAIPLLLVSETGTGKDVMARAVHDSSARAGAPFVAVNCASFTSSLLQSELFGYGAGAFTGALRTGRAGFVEVADGGTLFLDEVADLPPAAQAALLRFLEDGSFYRVGETRERRVDVRVLSATCRDLEAEVERGVFRRDLYFRLRGARLELPPLRERNDLADLAQRFAARAAEEQERPVPRLSASALAAVLAHTWPGNFRELRQAMRVAVAMADGAREIEHEHLPPDVAGAAPPTSAPARATDRSLDDVVAQFGGNVSAAARALGVARSTIYRRLSRAPTA